METGLPVWAGLSGREGEDGSLVSFASSREIPFREVVSAADRPGLVAIGVMHTKSALVSGAISAIRDDFGGPVYAYPDAGTFEMPVWRFDEAFTPEVFAGYARKWIGEGIGGVGGCCGLTPEHIRASARVAEEGGA